MKQVWGLPESQIKRNAEFDASLPSNKMFIIGTGRSGTHWMGAILASHPRVRITIEEPELFFRATRMALDETTRYKLFPELINLYQRRHELSLPRHYADKSHPTIWVAEELAEVFPTAKFVGMQRGPFATVASMVKHKGVQKWIGRWREFPLPNPFLGIDEFVAEDYENLSLASKCTLRWQAHALEMERLQKTLGHRLLVVEYEGLIAKSRLWLERLQKHLQLPEAFANTEVKVSSLEAWKKELTSAQKRDINKMLRGYGT